MIKFSYTILYVKDVTASISFYETAFGFSRTFITPDNSYGELSTGDTTLSFASFEMALSNLSQGYTRSDVQQKPFGIEIGITTDDVQATFEQAVKAGAIPLEEASYKPHGQTVAYVRDPDGFLVEIFTPIS